MFLLSEWEHLCSFLSAFFLSKWQQFCDHWKKVCAVSIILVFWLICPISGTAIPLCLLFSDSQSSTLIFIGVSIVWAYFSQNIPERGGLPMDWSRTCWPWPVIRDYFSHKIVKTAELPPNRSYLIGSHPHGILHVGGTLTFAGKVSGFNDLFPGLTQCILTLQGQFRWPYRRETMMFIGVNSCSPDSIEYLLNNPGPGRAVALVIGGLSESLMSRPGRYDIKIKNRKGFVRQALIHGADLVPCYHFGEVDIFDHEKGNDEKKVKNMQAHIRNVIGFLPPFLKGSSIFGCGLPGLMPFQRPITSVIGAPIAVTRKEHPSEEEVDALHEKYCAALCELFENHKHRHGIPEDAHLNIF
uniref:Acyltransferase n=1 Tax=Pristionchus pacificus TaxID=54126 RepID=A0A8R1UX50_PRIPA